MMAEGIVKQHDVKDFGRTIRDESGRMITLIDDIIKLSKLDENSFPEEFSEVDLMESAKDVIERLSMKAEEKGVSMYLEAAVMRRYTVSRRSAARSSTTCATMRSSTIARTVQSS